MLPKASAPRSTASRPCRSASSDWLCQYIALTRPALPKQAHPMPPKKELKTRQLQTRVSEEEKVRIQERAARAGMDVSKWLLRMALPRAEVRFQSLCREPASRHRIRACRTACHLLTSSPPPFRRRNLFVDPLERIPQKTLHALEEILGGDSGRHVRDAGVTHT
jgi:hypothetical protein